MTDSKLIMYNAVKEHPILRSAHLGHVCYPFPDGKYVLRSKITGILFLRHIRIAKLAYVSTSWIILENTSLYGVLLKADSLF